jgi:hypothetical protein
MSKQILYNGTAPRKLLDEALAKNYEVEFESTQRPPTADILSRMMALLRDSKAPYKSRL